MQDSTTGHQYTGLTLICSTIFRIWGSNPMSNILSASSSTKYVHLLRFVFPASKKSINRPGVAIHISAPVMYRFHHLIPLILTTLSWENYTFCIHFEHLYSVNKLHIHVKLSGAVLYTLFKDIIEHIDKFKTVYVAASQNFMLASEPEN